MAKITLTGNLFIQLAGESKPAPLPLNLDLDYTEKSVVDYVWTSTQTNFPLNQGTVTAPRFIFVEVTEGAVQLAPDPTTIDGHVFLSANPTPAANESPARMLFFTYAPEATQWYATTTELTRAKIWFFE